MNQQNFYNALTTRKDIEIFSPSEYDKIHTDILIPTIFKINNTFEEEIKQYHKYFVQWGNTHTEYHRYGLSLVNRTGDYTDKESNSPLDTHYEQTGEILWDIDFTVPTQALNIKSLNVLNPIKKYMIRSNILWWNELGHFKPHVDISKNFFTHIRLWGTNKTSSEYLFKFNNEKINFEPGRLYICDTSITHEAKALTDYCYTYFISVKKEILDEADILL